MKFKKGDLIYYNQTFGPYIKLYCIIQEIKVKQLWGHWCDTEQEAKTNKNNSLTQYMPEDKCFKIEITNWRKEIGN